MAERQKETRVVEVGPRLMPADEEEKKRKRNLLLSVPFVLLVLAALWGGEVLYERWHRQPTPAPEQAPTPTAAPPARTG